MRFINKNTNVIFATFSPYSKNKRSATNGNVEPMISFFVPKVKVFTLIDQPHTGSKKIAPIIEEYNDGKERKKTTLDTFFYKPFYYVLQLLSRTDDDTSVLFKLRDFISVLHVGLASRFKYDYCIGFESINTLAFLLLKKLGRVKTVIYYVSDYSPVRYNNRIMNWLYLTLDKICCYSSDYIWDVSLAMHPARVKAGLNIQKSAPVIHVPNALFPQDINNLSLDKTIPNSLVFMGTLGWENGPDLTIEALKIVIKKNKNIRLHIIGKGEEDLARLKKLAKNLQLSKYITFHGFIPKNEDMLKLLRRFQIGLAPYKKIKNSVRWYGDSLKLRAYVANGLPVITTEVPPLGQELLSYGASIVVSDNKEAIAQAILDLFSDPNKYKKLRKRAIEYGENNTWEDTFTQAFEMMSNVNKKTYEKN